MRFRKYLFLTLSITSLLLALFFISNVQQARSKAAGKDGAYQVGASIGSDLVYNCTVLPSALAFVVFGLLAFRSHKGQQKPNAQESTTSEPLDPHLE